MRLQTFSTAGAPAGSSLRPFTIWTVQHLPVTLVMVMRGTSQRCWQLPINCVMDETRVKVRAALFAGQAYFGMFKEVWNFSHFHQSTHSSSEAFLIRHRSLVVRT